MEIDGNTESNTKGMILSDIFHYPCVSADANTELTNSLPSERAGYHLKIIMVLFPL